MSFAKGFVAKAGRETSRRRSRFCEQFRVLRLVTFVKPLRFMVSKSLAVQGDEIKLKKIVVLYRQC